MVQLMSTKPDSDCRKPVPVKREPEDSTNFPCTKRSKNSLSSSQQQGNQVTVDFPVPPSQYNPLDEPSPLGLRLRKSPSLLDLIQTTLSKEKSQKGVTQVKKEQKTYNAMSASDKLKASNFSASLLRIGTWEYKSRYEGDLVAKCYFAKHKLVWEVLDGGLKNKIEIQWSDILALKGNYPDDAPGTLDVVLSRQPLFFRETNPQPRKHTLWQATSDFTGGQASKQRRHFLQCPPGLMGKHFEKLVQCDPRLNVLSQQGEIVLDSPYFEPRVSIFENGTSETNHRAGLKEEDGQALLDMYRSASPSTSSSPLRSERDFVARHSEQFSRHSTSPSLVIDSHSIEDITSTRAREPKGLLEKDNLQVPGLHSSMSMSDLVSHIEHRIAEQNTYNDFPFSSEGRQSLGILDEIRNCLFSESQHALAADEKCLMSRVNSLCCLLQKDPSQNIHKAASTFDLFEDYRIGEADSVVATAVGESDVFGFRNAATMSRKDSVEDLLHNLPRITSLPQFLFDISEDTDSE